MTSNHEYIAGVGAWAEIEVISHLPLRLELVIISLQGRHRTLSYLVAPIQTSEYDKSA